jgi:hypothetical protein
MLYYVYDVDGCAYKSSIVISTEELKVSDEYYEYFDYSALIGTAKTAKEANMIASKYLYECQKAIDLSYSSEYYEFMDEDGVLHNTYPEFDEDYHYIEFV